MTTPPARRSRFRTDIEGLRAVAVLGVLAFHAGVPHVGGGYVGVDVFYVISGFLITQLMVRECNEAPVPSFGRFLSGFYARRARRILPAATLVLVMTLFGATLVQNALENVGVAADARATTLFYSNIHFAAQASDYFAAGNAPSPYLQYWSLSLEEQFYLIWPIAFFALLVWSRHRNRPNATVGIGIAAIVVASFAVSILWMRTSPVRAFYLLPARAWELGVGALIAIHEPRIASIPHRLAIAFSLVGLLAIMAVMVLFTGSTPFPGWMGIPPVFGAGLVIAGGCNDSVNGIASRALAIVPMQRIGRYSFALYLWHWPALVLRVEHFKWLYATWPIRTAFMFATSLPVAALTYQFIENPLRRARSLRSSDARSISLGIVFIAIGLISVSTFQYFGNGGALSTDRVVAATSGHLASPVVPTDFVPANLVPSLPDSRDRTYVVCGSPCVVGPVNGRRKIILFGNSHAGHWGAAFEGAAARLGARVEIHAPGGCASFLIPAELMLTPDRVGCDDRRQRVFASIEATKPDIVVLSNMTADVFAAHPAEWERGVRDAIRRISKTTVVVVFSETPRGSTSVPLCLARNLEHAERCDQRWPEAINQRLETISREEGAQFVDLRPLFCTATRCPAITEDTLIYGDTDHLTVPFSRARGAWMADILERSLQSQTR